MMEAFIGIAFDGTFQANRSPTGPCHLALEKARKHPNSNKARILVAARRLFGEYGFQGTTTRMIAKAVGIDISTLYYHWGEKADLYEAVIIDLNEGIEAQFKIIETTGSGTGGWPIAWISPSMSCATIFMTPRRCRTCCCWAISANPKREVSLDEKVAGHIANIAIAMGLATDRQHITPQAKARIMTLWNSVLNFISGESFFRPILGVDQTEYLDVVKETLKF
jgi:AcrR family transcriptional regulator